MQKIIKYLSEVREQFKNISWPKKDALVQLTFVVITISVVISLILGGFDYLFTNSFAFLSQLKAQPQIEVSNGDPQITPEVTPSLSPATTATPSPKSKK